MKVKKFRVLALILAMIISISAITGCDITKSSENNIQSTSSSASNPEFVKASQELTEFFKNYSYGQACQFLMTEEKIPENRIHADKSFSDKNDYVVTGVEMNEREILLHVSKSSAKIILEKQLLNTRLNDAEKMIELTGLEYRITKYQSKNGTKTTKKASVSDASNWFVKAVEISSISKSSLDITLYVEKDKNLLEYWTSKAKNVASKVGDLIFDVVAPLVWEEFKAEHPIITAAINTWLS